MRRPALLIPGLVLVLVALLAASRLPATHAQEGTPPVVGLPAGVTVEPIAFDLAAAPPGLAAVRLTRVRLEPGARLALSPDDPSLAVVAVESGTLAVRATAPVVVSRAAGTATPGAATPEQIAAGTAFRLGPGDAFVGPPYAGGELRNDGPEPAVILTAAVVPEPEDRGVAAPAVGPGGGDDDRSVVVALAVVMAPPCPNGFAPSEMPAVGTPGAGGGGGGSGSVAVAVAASPQCAGDATGGVGTPTP